MTLVDAIRLFYKMANKCQDHMHEDEFDDACGLMAILLQQVEQNERYASTLH